MHDFGMNDGSDILALRQTLGWSQLAMADYLGLDRSTVSRLERGSRAIKKPVYELLRRLAETGAREAPMRPAPPARARAS